MHLKILCGRDGKNKRESVGPENLTLSNTSLLETQAREEFQFHLWVRAFGVLAVIFPFFLAKGGPNFWVSIYLLRPDDETMR